MTLIYIYIIDFKYWFRSLWVEAEDLHLSAPLEGAVRAVMLALNNYRED